MIEMIINSVPESLQLSYLRALRLDVILVDSPC